ncbi:cellulose synthase operon protein YhjQ [Alcaligenaceae bacterium]|nr:cellulose synthase operon protein YhjQ [Alcaligenaceae bacterium]
MRIALWGLRGGAGTSSLAALLGDALSQLGETVVLVDLNSADLLRLHFNIAYDDAHGWASAKEAGRNWYEPAYQVKENLFVLPYGRHGVDAGALQRAVRVPDEQFWVQAGASLAAQYPWVIFDLPAGGECFASLRAQCELDIVVAPVDMASHILLSQCRLTEHTRILVNGHDPARRLGNDILLDWRQAYRDRLVPVAVRQDENIHEALAYKMPATTYFPDGAGTHDAISLATWCIAQRGAGQ